MPPDLISCPVLAGVIGPMLALDLLHAMHVRFPTATPPADAPSL